MDIFLVRNDCMNNNKVYESLYKFFDNSFKMLDKFDKSIMNLYETEYNRLSKELYNHDLNKPSKLFKNKYNKWCEERNNIEKEQQNILKKIEEEINYL